MMINKKEKNNEYGEPAPYDPTFSGPVQKRACTDVLCCIIFFAAMVGYVILGGAAWLYGNPQYIIYQQNSAGGFCGIGPNVDKPNVFYFDVLKCASAANVTAATFKGLQCPTTQVCVKKCPSTFWFLPPKAFIAGAKPSEFFQQELCDPSLDLARTTLTIQEILNKDLCPAYYMPTKQVQGKCLPSFDPKDIPSDFSVPGLTLDEKTLKNIMDATSALRSGFNAKSMKVRIIEDLAFTWYWILIGLVITLVVSMVLILLMRFCVSVVVVVLLVGVLSVGAYGRFLIFLNTDSGILLMLIYSHAHESCILQSKMSDILQVKEIWLAFLVIVSLLEFILLVLFVSCLRKGFLKALAMMRQCSKAMGAMFSVMVFPLVTFLLVTLCVSFCAVTSINLATSGLPVYYKVALNSSNPECAVITGNQPCVPESFKASDYPNCPVRCVFAQYDEEGGYHTGSLAFGAVFVNMFQGIRIVLQYLKNVTKGGQRCSWCCCPLIIILRSCFCALDTVIKYFNRNTYIMIAVYGDNFFISARNACMLWGRNKDRVLVVDRVTDLLLFFGRLLVVGAIGVLAFCFFSGEIRVSADIFQAELLNFCWLPILVLMVGSYFIALGCFSVYSMGVDTFTLCVMDDLERHDGTLQRPYMSRSMMEILQKQKEFDV
ncbi:choline transporter-like protein 4 [Hemibagrus wyckioides]|uniref:choline transporter-like protein 4 n=1 Tax=Hemibagrus wyckioides TaxID=337641 RepID=UPI00266DD1BE|nr:choline transporter-like protein 4 [Hemibagrus wyckioides]